MPKTKLDKRRARKVEQDTFIIKKAMADNRIYTDSELAKLLGTSGSHLSKCFKGGFSTNMKVRLYLVLKLSEEDFRRLLGVTL